MEPIAHLLRLSIMLAAISTAVALTMPAAHAQQQPFYKGKRLTVLVNFAAGGPADIESRIVARHLVKHIDGQPSLVMQNLDGAGGFVGAQYLGEVAAKDGTVLGALTGTAWIYVSDPARWRTDLRHYEFVARQPSTTVYFARTDVAPGLKTPADLAQAKGVIIGGLSAESSKDLRLRLTLDLLGVPYQYVTGYRSSPAARLALQRGEINMYSESPPSYRSVVVPQLVTPGTAMGLFYDEISETPPVVLRQVDGLPISSFFQLYRQVKGSSPSGPLWDAYRTLHDMNATLLRVLALPPGAPPAAAAALRKAVERLRHDKEFAAEATKVIEFVPEYETAPDIAEQIRAMLVMKPEMRTYINAYMKNVPRK